MIGILALTGIACGAFGAHALRDQVSPDRLAVWNTGAHYQQIQSIAALCFLLAAKTLDNPKLIRAAWCVATGVVIFSGTLYALVLTNVKWLGAITPLGGVLMMVGWGIAIWAGAQRLDREQTI